MVAVIDDYELHTEARDDINEGWIWIKDDQLKYELEGRRQIVRVRCSGGPPVYCEALYAADFDIRRFREHIKSKSDLSSDRMIFISAWYRNLLGISEKLESKIDVEIKLSNSPLWFCRACFQHPQAVVLLATVLAFIGAGLGVIGVGLALIGGKDEFGQVGQWVGWAVVLAGLILSIISLVPLFRRVRPPRVN